MKGDKKIIEFLNKVLKNELTAINQYFLHSRILEDWGITKLAKHEYQESIEEMQHADEVIKRILFLEGLPNLQHLDKLRIGEDVKEILECDLALEHDAVKDLKDAIAYADQVRDFTSRELFIKILVEEEAHIDTLETQLESIKQQGLENFIQSESGSSTTD